MVLLTWGPHTFIQYIRTNAHGAYYNDPQQNDTPSSDNTEGGGPGHAGSSDAPTGGQTTGRYNLCSSTIRQSVHSMHQPDERSVGEMMDLVLALWARTARKGRKREPTDVPDPTRNEGVKMWLQSVEESRDDTH